MGKLGDFFSKVVRSVLPNKYGELTEYTFRTALKQFFLLLLLVTAVASLLYIPSLVIFPFEFEREFEKFETFSIDLNVSTKEPVDFGFLEINTQETDPSVEKEGVYITQDFMSVKILPFFSATKADINDFRNVLDLGDTLKTNVILVTVLLAPYLFLLMYLYHAAKYLLLAFITATVLVILIRTAQGEVRARRTLKIALWATPFLMLELFLQAFSFTWFFHSMVPYILYVIIVITGTVMHMKSPEYGDKSVRYTKDDEEFVTAPQFKNGKTPAITPSGDEDIDISKIQEEIEKHRV